MLNIYNYEIVLQNKKIYDISFVEKIDRNDTIRICDY